MSFDLLNFLVGIPTHYYPEYYTVFSEKGKRHIPFSCAEYSGHGKRVAAHILKKMQEWHRGKI